MLPYLISTPKVQHMPMPPHSEDTMYRSMGSPVNNLKRQETLTLLKTTSSREFQVVHQHPSSTVPEHIQFITWRGKLKKGELSAIQYALELFPPLYR